MLNCTPSVNDLKYLGAALASSGAVALYHVEHSTPEYKDALKDVNLGNIENIIVNRSNIDEKRCELSTTNRKPDLICLGCPHVSLDEIKAISDKLVGLKLKNQLWVCTSISVKSTADRMGYTKIIEDAGGKIVCDTCMVVAPIEELGFKVIGVDSAKAANYIPTMCGLDVIFDDFEKLIQIY